MKPILTRSVLLLALLLTSSVALPTTPTRAASGSVQPPQGTPGSAFHFEVDGMGEQERVGAWVVDPHGQTYDLDVRLFANSAGRLTWDWVAPQHAIDGEWTMYARGKRTSEQLAIPFTIRGTPPQGPPPPSTIVEPAAGAPGTTFTFVARGSFQPHEQVASWLLLPDGSSVDAEQGISVDASGQIYRQWSAPAHAMDGTWVFRASGLISGFEIDIPFTIHNPANVPPPPPSYRVEPAHGTRGTTFTFHASGFDPREHVGTWLVAPDGENIHRDFHEWLHADEQHGDVTWTWTAPADALDGNWQMNIRGFNSRVEWSIPFTIGGFDAEPTPAPQFASYAAPAAAPAGTRFRFGASGFSPGETVFFWALDGNGRPYPNSKTAEADALGRAEWTWEVHADRPPGQWNMVARGDASRNEVQIPFVVSSGLQQAIAMEPQGSGAPGTTFTFHASGFYANEPIDLWLTGPDMHVRRFDQEYDLVDRPDIRSDAQGNVQWTWTAPANALAGRWRMSARGEESRALQVIDFDIVRTEPLPLPFSVSPASGPPGTTFTFRAENIPSDRAAYWLTLPDGSTIPEEWLDSPDWKLWVDPHGSVTWTWTAPDNASVGQWTMVVRNLTVKTQPEAPGTVNDDKEAEARARAARQFEEDVRQTTLEYREYAIPFTIEPAAP